MRLRRPRCAAAACATSATPAPHELSRAVREAALGPPPASPHLTARIPLRHQRPFQCARAPAGAAPLPRARPIPFPLMPFPPGAVPWPPGRCAPNRVPPGIAAISRAAPRFWFCTHVFQLRGRFGGIHVGGTLTSGEGRWAGRGCGGRAWARTGRSTGRARERGRRTGQCHSAAAAQACGAAPCDRAGGAPWARLARLRPLARSRTRLLGGGGWRSGGTRGRGGARTGSDASASGELSFLGLGVAQIPPLTRPDAAHHGGHRSC